MVKAGYAWVYKKYCRSSFCSDWLALENNARNKKLGLWKEKVNNQMEIKSTRQASRAMTIAFKITTKMVGKSDHRRAEIRSTAKKLIDAAENYMTPERMKCAAKINQNK